MSDTPNGNAPQQPQPQPQGQPQPQPQPGAPQHGYVPPTQTYGYPYGGGYGGYCGYPQAQPAAPTAAQRLTCMALLAALVLLFGGMCLLSMASLGSAGAAASGAAGGADLHEQTVAGDGPNKIALIEIDGVIADTQAAGGLFGTAVDLVGRIEAELAKAAKDDKVKGVVLRIDSPGGTVGASDRIWHLVSEFRRKTPKVVVISMGGTCASGGYYIAAAGDYLIAEPTTITGSIGVILSTLNFAELLKQHGVADVTIKSGPNKDLLNSTAPPNPEHQAILQKMVDETYARFVKIVADGRSALTLEKVRQLADGRIYTAQQALDNQLIDKIGYQEDAFSEACTRANTGPARLVRYRRQASLADVLGGRAAAPLLGGRVEVDPSLVERLTGPRLLMLWRGR
ncbi:MAG: signal peptide peptidase SppA [Planctomycetota bacterium]